MGRWIRGCAADGYDAVELDNLDSWTTASTSCPSSTAGATCRVLGSVVLRDLELGTPGSPGYRFGRC